MNTFENWCALRNVQPLPAAPADVAKFVADIAPLGIEKVWPLVCEISRAHYVIGLADPTLGGWVATAINDISQLKAPHKWPEQHKRQFVLLPYDLQAFLVEEERRQTAVVDAAIRKAAEARKEAGLPKLQKSFYRNAGKKPNGNSSHPPLEERIANIRADIDAFIDARVAEDRKRYPDLPDEVVRRGLTGGLSCQCAAYVKIKATDEPQSQKGAA